MNIDPKQTKKLASVLIGIIAIIALMSIWDQWNEMWYHFGENIYFIIHKLRFIYILLFLFFY